MKLMRWSVKRAIGIILGVLAIACVFEFAIRFFLGLGNPPLLEKDSEIGYLFRPNQDVYCFGNRIVINRFSQRGEDTTEKPAGGVTHLMVVGDSVTFGGVLIPHDETYPEMLGGALGAKREKRFEVLNASAASWGIGNELAYLERFGTLHSESVIWQIGSHDLLQPKSTSEGVGVHPAMPAEKPLCVTIELFSRYNIFRPSPSSASDPVETKDELRSQFDQNMIWLTQGIELVRKHGAKVCIVHTPDRHDVVRGPDGNFQEKYTSYRKEFLTLARELKVPMLDLVDEWKDRPGIATAFRDQVHFSSEGNRIMADGLELFLKENQLLDAFNTMRP